MGINVAIKVIVYKEILSSQEKLYKYENKKYENKKNKDIEEFII